MKRSNKKGFTIVELVIVIAVIAILAAVLIPNISRLVRKANASSDLSLVRNLNTALAVENQTYATAHEAFEVVKEAGYDLTKIEAKASGSQILFDSVNQCFVYLNNGKLEYYPNTQKTALTAENYYKLWAIETEVKADGDYTYSVYWNGAADANITVKGVGFDAGNVAVKSVKYNGDATAHTVAIRTNNFDTTLTIDAENDTIYHYEQVGSVNIVKVASASYHKNGAVKGNIVVAQGRVEVAEKASVATVIVTGDEVKIDTKNETNILVSETVSADKQPVVNGKEYSSDSKAALVTTWRELKEALTSGKTAVLNADITSSAYIDLGTSSPKDATSAVLNLNGHRLTYTANFKYLFKLAAGKQLTVEGIGTVEATGTASIFRLYSDTNNASSVVINGGEYIATANDGGSSLILVERKGSVTINGGSFLSKDACVGMLKEANLEINGGEFTSKDNFVIGTNGATENSNNTITINGGTFNGSIESSDYIACGIYLANKDTLVVNGGTFNITNGVAILVRSGNATIGKDVVINLYNENGGIEPGKVGDSIVKISAATAIVMDQKSGYAGGNPTVTNESKYETYDNSDNSTAQ